MRRAIVCTFLTAALVRAGGAGAAVTAFPMDLAGFEAAASSPPPVVVDFESIAPGTDIGGQTVNGIQFVAVSAPLIVVRGADTVTPAGFSGTPDPDSNKLPATSGENVLSPGGAVLGPGPDPAVEGDSLTLVFSVPVSAVGFDHLSQSADGFGFTSVTVKDAADAVLFAGPIPVSGGGGGAPGGADFWGVVSDQADILRVELVEGDANASFPDANIGLDTIRAAGLPSVSTTTTTTAVTTTTSPSGACTEEATFASLNCRLGALLSRVTTGGDLGRLTTRLTRAVTKAKQRKEQAEDHCSAGDARRAGTALKKALRKVVTFDAAVRSGNGRRVLVAEVREELRSAAAGIRRDLRTLRGALVCPPA